MMFVVCGEALIDLVPESRDAPGTADGPDAWRALPAGGPMTTAIALARLGEDVALCGRVSTDAFGRRIAAHLADSGVGTDLLVRSARPTALAVVGLDDAGRASYAFHLRDTATFAWRADELPALDAGAWLHVASLALVVEPGAAVLRDWAAGHAGPMSLDANVRPSVIADPVEYWARMRPWFEVLGARGGVLKASDEDLAVLARGAGLAGPDAEPRALARRWADEFGFAVAVVTLGPDGAYAYAPGPGAGAAATEVAVPGRRVDLVDTIGAGDTFMGAFLAAFRRAPLEAALTEAVAASALVCERRGAQPPAAREVRAALGG